MQYIYIIVQGGKFDILFLNEHKQMVWPSFPKTLSIKKDNDLLLVEFLQNHIPEYLRYVIEYRYTRDTKSKFSLMDITHVEILKVDGVYKNNEWGVMTRIVFYTGQYCVLYILFKDYELHPLLYHRAPDIYKSIRIINPEDYPISDIVSSHVGMKLLPCTLYAWSGDETEPRMIVYI